LREGTIIQPSHLDFERKKQEKRTHVTSVPYISKLSTASRPHADHPQDHSRFKGHPTLWRRTKPTSAENEPGRRTNSLVPQQPKPLCRPLVLSHSQTHLFVVSFFSVVTCLFFAERCAESEGGRKVKEEHGRRLISGAETEENGRKGRCWV
jgi:hypothetical protein